MSLVGPFYERVVVFGELREGLYLLQPSDSKSSVGVVDHSVYFQRTSISVPVSFPVIVNATSHVSLGI